MKRCPECYEIYENSEKFCELDGSRLLFDPALSTDVSENDSARSEGPGLKSQSVAGLIGLMVGIILCLGIYTVWTLQANTQKQEVPVKTSRIYEAAPQRLVPASIPAPEPTATESPDEEADDTAAPSEESKVAESTTVTARLNQGPVSTGRPVVQPNGAEVQTFIEMTDGSTLDVDAAWEDTQGIWYRRGGLVSFLESHRVKAISARNEPKSSSASNK